MRYNEHGDIMTKEKVLQILKQNIDYVSGEEISGKLNISRAAVNSAVKALRNEGYEIASVTNRGYKLNGSPDILSWGSVCANLTGDRGERVLVLSETESTNTWLKNEEAGLPDGFVVIADSQTKGRGRMGRSFSSPKGKGVYLSILLRPSCLPSDAANLTAWTAVAICDAVEKVSGARPQIKWINDPVMNGKKISGILTEMSIEGESGRIQYVVIGIGVNANNESDDFPDDIKDVATSIYVQTGNKVDRGLLAAEMIKALDKMYDSWPNEKEKYLSAYRKDCITTGKDVKLIRNGEERKAFAKEIDDDFALVVRLPDGREETVFTGEASVRGMYGYTD